MSYLSATYTPVRPFYGHVFNTPQVRRREKQVGLWFATSGRGVSLGPVDYVLIRREDLAHFPDRSGWKVLHANDELLLFGPARKAP